MNRVTDARLSHKVRFVPYVLTRTYMTRTLLSITFGIVLATQISVAQDITWSPKGSLSWNDFKGKPDTSNPYHASTQSGVQYLSSWQSSGGKTKLSLTVFAYFDKKRSWLKEGKGTDRLLRHEQLHFDISELHARLLRKELSTYAFTDKHDDEVQRLFKENTKARNTMQERYDAETNHMINKEAQLAWEDSIAARLSELEDYSGQKVVVEIPLR